MLLLFLLCGSSNEDCISLSNAFASIVSVVFAGFGVNSEREFASICLDVFSTALILENNTVDRSMPIIINKEEMKR